MLPFEYFQTRQLFSTVYYKVQHQDLPFRFHEFGAAMLNSKRSYWGFSSSSSLLFSVFSLFVWFHCCRSLIVSDQPHLINRHMSCSHPVIFLPQVARLSSIQLNTGIKKTKEKNGKKGQKNFNHKTVQRTGEIKYAMRIERINIKVFALRLVAFLIYFVISFPRLHSHLRSHLRSHLCSHSGETLSESSRRSTR